MSNGIIEAVNWIVLELYTVHTIPHIMAEKISAVCLVRNRTNVEPSAQLPCLEDNRQQRGIAIAYLETSQQ